MGSLFAVYFILSAVIGGNIITEAKEHETKSAKGNSTKALVTQVIGCSGDTILSITCSAGTVIQIASTDFGRHSTTICPYHDPAAMTNTQCSYDETAKHADLCNGHQNCAIRLADEVYDPCYGTYKYLTVNYICVDVPIGVETHLIGCHHSILRLSCSASSVIQVSSADFGRHSTTKCPYHDANAMKNTQCTLDETLKLSKQCNGHQFCDIEVDTVETIDPCYGTYKYLSANYTCKEVLPEVKCGVNEEYGCDNPCFRHCHKPRFCQSSCDKRCVCKEGYKRDSATGKCIDENYCPQSS